MSQWLNRFCKSLFLPCLLFVGCSEGPGTADDGTTSSGGSEAIPSTGGTSPAGSGGNASASSTGGTSSGGTSGEPAAGGAPPAGSGGTDASGGSGGAGGSVASGGGSGETSASGGNPGSGGTGGSPPAPVDQDTLEPAVLHLAGDSTVMTYDAGSAQEGWGQELGQFFIEKLTINNQAIGGASIRTFQTGRWVGIVNALQPGDSVMIQFGANDSGTVDGRHVEPDDFAQTLREYAADVLEKQGTPIFVTPSALQQWQAGVEGNERLGPYAQAMRDVGSEQNVPVVDLNDRSVELLNRIGQQAAQEIYINGDKAHFTKKGAIQMATLITEELQRIGNPLADYLMMQ